MQITDISSWGVVLIVALTAMVMGLLALVDRKTMQRLAKVLMFLACNMAVVALYAWAMCHWWHWWLGLLWVVLLSVSVAVLVASRVRQRWQRLLPALLPAVLAGMLVGWGSVRLVWPHLPSAHLLLGMTALMACQLVASLTKALQAFVGSLHHAQSHYRYLLANGATHIEALMPSVRRSLRATLIPSFSAMSALLMVMPPILFCGLLLAGTAPVAAVVATVLVLLAQLVGSVAATLTMLCLLDRILFDKLGQLK